MRVQYCAFLYKLNLSSCKFPFVLPSGLFQLSETVLALCVCVCVCAQTK
jgi:hypothetical protein